MSLKLEYFLEQKGAEYAPFDARRAPTLLKQLNLSFSANQSIIHIIGTNGKGSTGRFLALMLKALGIKVGHFTSPHLLSLCERFWIDGKNVAESVLECAFTSLDVEILRKASYFEVLTFLAFEVFKDCEVVILEAGLGGEYDSTITCCAPQLTLFTSIGIDHQDYLGASLEEIAITKLNAMAKTAVLGIQREEKTISIAAQIAKEKKAHLVQLHTIPQEIFAYIKKKHYPSYQAQNLTLAWQGLLAFEQLKTLPCVALESLLEILPPLDLQGRFQQCASNIYLDVLHNVDGAKALLEHYEAFNKNQTILIYNSYFDKNPKAILSLLKPMIKRVEIFAVQNVRIIKKSALEEILESLEIPYCDFCSIDVKEKYLVCGSFSVVAKFLATFKQRVESTI